MNNQNEIIESLRKEIETKNSQIKTLEALVTMLIRVDVKLFKKLEITNRSLCNSLDTIPNEVKDSDEYADLNEAILYNSIFIEESESLLESISNVVRI